MRDFTGVSGATEDGLAKVSPAPATRWTPEVGNAIVQEIKTVITDAEGGDAALDPAINRQLLDAILAIAARAVSESTPPEGYYGMPGYTFNPDGTREAWVIGTANGNGYTTIAWPEGVEFTTVLFAVGQGGVASADAQDNNPFVSGFDASGVTFYSSLDGSTTVRAWGKGV